MKGDSQEIKKAKRLKETLQPNLKENFGGAKRIRTADLLRARDRLSAGGLLLELAVSASNAKTAIYTAFIDFRGWMDDERQMCMTGLTIDLRKGSFLQQREAANRWPPPGRSLGELVTGAWRRASWFQLLPHSNTCTMEAWNFTLGTFIRPKTLPESSRPSGRRQPPTCGMSPHLGGRPPRSRCPQTR
jgi:hypothetical protein